MQLKLVLAWKYYADFNLNMLLKIQKAFWMQESHWEIGSGFQFWKEQVGCPAPITSLKQKVWECAPSPLFSFPFFSPSPSSSLVLDFVLIVIILFYFWQGVNWSDSPTLLDSASGHKWPEDFWEHFSYNWGHSKIILCQLENEAVISPGSAQHKGRGAPSPCSISF